MRRIVLLNQTDTGDGITFQQSVIFRFSVTSGQQTQSSGSICPTPTSQENTDVQSGNVIEENHSFTVPTGTPLSVIESIAQQTWANRNSVRNLKTGGQATGYALSFDDSTGVWA